MGRMTTLKFKLDPFFVVFSIVYKFSNCKRYTRPTQAKGPDFGQTQKGGWFKLVLYMPIISPLTLAYVDIYNFNVHNFECHCQRINFEVPNEYNPALQLP